MKPVINNLIAMAHVADVQRSADSIPKWAFESGTFKNDAGGLCWVDLRSGEAALMLRKADAPVMQDSRLFCSNSTPTT